MLKKMILTAVCVFGFATSAQAATLIISDGPIRPSYHHYQPRPIFYAPPHRRPQCHGGWRQQAYYAPPRPYGRSWGHYSRW